MYTININPILFKIGFLEVRYYGIAYIIGLLLVYYYLYKNKEKLSLNDEKLDSLMLYVIIGLLIGARLFDFLIENPLTFINDPLEIFKIWHGGMSFFGGFIGLIAAVYLFSKNNKINFLKLSDYIVLPASFGLIFGRIANLINQELVGTVTNVDWCFQFSNYSGCRHPYQIYAAITHLILFFILLYITKIKENKRLKDGIVFLWFGLLYSVFRFFVDFYREGVRYFGLTNWQYVSLIVFVVCGYYAVINFKEK